MKYFNPSYWFKLWFFVAPLFSTQNKGINSMPIGMLDIESAIESSSNFKKTESVSHKHRHSNHEKIEAIVENWQEKNETCIHETGHAIVAYFSSSIKDNLNYLEVYNPNNVENNDRTLGIIERKNYPYISDYSDQELIESISSNTAGYLAEDLFSDYDLFPNNLIESSDWSMVKARYSEIKKRNHLIYFNQIKNTYDDRLWFLDDLIKNAIINATKIIKENKKMFMQIHKMCMLKSKVTKEDLDFVNQYKILPKEYLLIEKQYLKNKKNELGEKYEKNKNKLKELDKLNITEVNSLEHLSNINLSSNQSHNIVNNF